MDDKDSIRKEYMKKYREKNKEKLKEYHKKYYNENREKMLEQITKKVYCDVCGIHVSKKLRHNETKKHLKNLKSREDDLEFTINENDLKE